MSVNVVVDSVVRGLKKEVITDSRITKVGGVGLFCILIALGAFVYLPLPFTPVPVTLQTLFVLLSGMILGKDGAVSQLVYLTLGSLGVPIFAVAQGGIFSITMGYIIGFILAAWLVGEFFHSIDSTIGKIFVLCVADGIILVAGTIWMNLFFNLNIIRAFQVGTVPFILGDMLKIVLAISIYRIYKLIKK